MCSLLLSFLQNKYFSSISGITENFQYLVCEIRSQFFVDYYIMILPEFILVNFVLIIITYATFFVKEKLSNNLNFFNLVVRWLQLVLVLLIMLMLLIEQYLNIFVIKSKNFEYELIKNFLFSDQILIDWPTYVLKILLLVLFLAVVVILKSYSQMHKFYEFEFVLIIILSFIGSLAILQAFDFLILYVAVELQALAFYVLAGYKTNSLISVEAAIKYFILGAFASAFWLWGISFIYGATGSLNFVHLNQFLVASNIFNYSDVSLLFGLTIFGFGVLFKLGVVPFHVWLPDVYQGSPLPVTMLFSTVPKISLIFILFKFQFFELGSILITKLNTFGNIEFVFENRFNYLNFIFLLTGLLSIVVGSIAGLGQHNIKRLFAYSSITNIGFTILALGLNTVFGLQILFIYLSVYMILTVNFFALFMAIKVSSPKTIFIKIFDFSNLNLPVLNLFLALNFFSLAGIPPLIGFYSKFLVYLALLDSAFVYLVIFVAILTVFSTFYYVRLISLIFFIPSLRAVISNYFGTPAALEINPIKMTINSDLLILILFTSFLNIFAIIQFDYLILLGTKFVFLLF